MSKYQIYFRAYASLANTTEAAKATRIKAETPSVVESRFSNPALGVLRACAGTAVKTRAPAEATKLTKETIFLVIDKQIC